MGKQLFTCSLTTSHNLPHIHNTMKVLIALFCLLAVALASPSPKNAFTCDLRVDIITDIDEFLTSDTTEQQIVDFVKEICAALGPSSPGWRRPATSWSSPSSQRSSRASSM